MAELAPALTIAVTDGAADHGRERRRYLVPTSPLGVLEPYGRAPDMFRQMLRGKIHRATVTAADVNYVGSVTIDEALLEAADIAPNELVHVLDVDNGARLETYTIPAPAGSGQIQINGAAAHLVHPGDRVIIVAYSFVAEAEVRNVVPRIVHVDSANRVAEPALV